MTVIYHTHRGIRYVELPCAGCRDGNHVVSEDALDYYYESAPAQPYLCPTCRRRHKPKAVLYGEWHNGQQAVSA